MEATKDKQESKNPLTKLKEVIDDKEEQLAILGTFIRPGVMVWAGFIISLNYISLPGISDDKSKLIAFSQVLILLPENPRGKKLFAK